MRAGDETDSDILVGIDTPAAVAADSAARLYGVTTSRKDPSGSAPLVANGVKGGFTTWR